MNLIHEALRTMLESNPSALTDSDLSKLVSLDTTIRSTVDLQSYYLERCIACEYMLEVEGPVTSQAIPTIDYAQLYRLNCRVGSSECSSLCYASVGSFLLCIAIAKAESHDFITTLTKLLRGILSNSEFALHHMNTDGSIGSVCTVGQTGSRFVLSFTPTRTIRSLSISAEKSRRRCRSFAYPSLPISSPTPELATSNKARQLMRYSSTTYGGHRHSLFRSHSVGGRKKIQKNYETDNRILTHYFASSQAEDTAGPRSPTSGRWIQASDDSSTQTSAALPQSTLFVFYPPIEFDLKHLHLSTPTPPAPLLQDTSPPIEFLLPPIIPTISTLPSANRPGSLVNVIQDLVARRLLNRLSQSDGPFLRQDLLYGPRQYAPLNGYAVTRQNAEIELARALNDDPVAAEGLIAIATNQGVQSRPLLLQLSQGEWCQFTCADKFFRIGAHFLGPTVLDPPAVSPPLPEHEKGTLAMHALMDGPISFRTTLSNTEWKIRIEFETFSTPIFFAHLANSTAKPSLADLTFEDVKLGYKKTESGVIVTHWKGLIFEETGDVKITIDRSLTVEKLLAELGQSVPLQHGIRWPDVVELGGGLNAFDPKDSLRDTLHWCSSESLKLTLSLGAGGRPRIVVHRMCRIPIEAADQAPAEPTPHQSDGEVRPKMLWDNISAERWSSPVAQTVLSQSTGDTGDDGGMSPTARRRRAMERIAAGTSAQAIRNELNDLGVDVNTEYARYWTNNDVDDEAVVDTPSVTEPTLPPTERKRVMIVGLPPLPIGEDLSPRRVSMEAPMSPKSPSSPRSPSSPISSPRVVKTPVSPIGRSRRASLTSPSLPPSPKLLRSSKNCRQFEFHPFDANLMLIGSRSGVVSVIDTAKDFTIAQTRVDVSPILGLSWLRAHMNIALYGASNSGLVGIVKTDATTSTILHQPVARFPNLSSVTTNCTDDYFAVSGFSRDVSLYDLVTGKRIREMTDVHSNFINIVRFSNFSPHVFATSSFDSSVKLWDMRSPAKPSATFNTPTLNVMCAFSPLDESLLVSGLDSRIFQLSVKKNLQPTLSPEDISVPGKNSTTNYRRSVYLSDGSAFVTAGTDENFMRVIDAKSGRSRGVYRFDGLLDVIEKKINPVIPKPPAIGTAKPSVVVANPSSEVGLTPSFRRVEGPPGDNAGEYVQSLRGHPVFANEVGVLLYPYDRNKSSYVCTTQLPQ